MPPDDKLPPSPGDVAELKAEIAALKARPHVDPARLDAMEKKLDDFLKAMTAAKEKKGGESILDLF